MAKNVLNYLNDYNHIWVDIVRYKYGILNFWSDNTPPTYSWFLEAYVNLEYIHLSDLHNGIMWNHANIHLIFGDVYAAIFLNHGLISSHNNGH